MYCKSEMKKRELENYYSLEVNEIVSTELNMII